MSAHKKLVKFHPITNALPAGFSQPKDGTNWFVANAEIVDRAGDVIRSDGLYIPAGIPVLASHMHVRDDGRPSVVGRVEEVRLEKIYWDGVYVPAKLCRFSWARRNSDGEMTEFAKEHAEIWPTYLNRVSVGCFVIEAKPRGKRGLDVTRSECYEVSMVTVPACQAATALRGHDLVCSRPTAGRAAEIADELERIESGRERVSAGHLDDLECDITVLNEKGESVGWLLAKMESARTGKGGSNDDLAMTCVDILRRARQELELERLIRAIRE